MDSWAKQVPKRALARRCNAVIQKSPNQAIAGSGDEDASDQCSLSELDVRQIMAPSMVATDDVVVPRGRKRANAQDSAACSVCGREFRRYAALRDHMNIHTGATPYRCRYEHCDRAFKSASSLAVHERTHCSKLQFRCHFPHCSASFKHKLSLRNHQQVKHGLHCQAEQDSDVKSCSATPFENGSFKRFQCNSCKANFTQQQTLNRHVKSVHLGLKPHVCVECGARFPTRYTLSRHTRAHSDRLPEQRSVKRRRGRPKTLPRNSNSKSSKPSSLQRSLAADANVQCVASCESETEASAALASDNTAADDWNENDNTPGIAGESDPFADFDEAGVEGVEVDSDEEVQVFDSQLSV